MPPLDDDQRATLDALVDRLIPDDDGTAGALAAGAADYIVGMLAEAGEIGSYVTGLAAVDTLAHALHGEPFTALAPAGRDDVLGAMEGSSDPTLAAFFELLRLHTVHGTFSDPRHGGNRGGVGWDLIGFPGPKGTFAAAEQQLDAVVAPARSEPGLP